MRVVVLFQFFFVRLIGILSVHAHGGGRSSLAGGWQFCDQLYAHFHRTQILLQRLANTGAVPFRCKELERPERHASLSTCRSWTYFVDLFVTENQL